MVSARTRVCLCLCECQRACARVRVCMSRHVTYFYGPSIENPDLTDALPEAWSRSEYSRKLSK